MAIVYALISKDGYAYVGVTSNITKRFREHRCLLRNNKHHAKRMQDDWNRLGESINLYMIRLQETDYEKRGVKCEIEQKWINFYESQGLLYNSNKTSQGLGSSITRKGIEAARIANTGRIHSLESKEKRRQSQLGIAKNHGDKISATKKALGQKPTLSAASKGGKAASAKKRLIKNDDIV